MGRKRCKRRPWPAMPPRGLRPKLSRDQVLDLALAHVQNFDAIAKGQADSSTMWQAMGGVLTWTFVAGMLQLGESEMRVQHGVMLSVLDRWKRTGRVGFSGTEYQLAKEGLDVMDELAQRVDLATAVAAAEWSEQRINAMASEHQVAA